MAIRYKTGYSFVAKDMFHNFDFKKLKTPLSVLSIKNYGRNRRDIVASVLVYCFYLIVLDIIENNITFVLPTFRHEAIIHMKSYSGDRFKKMYNGGIFSDIDYVMSEFRGYKLCFRWTSPSCTKEKTIYINTKLKDRLTAHVNNGKQYY